MNQPIRNKGFRQRISKTGNHQYGDFIPFGTDGLLVDMDSDLDLEQELKLGGKHLSHIEESVDQLGNPTTTITENYATAAEMAADASTYYRVVHDIVEDLAEGTTSITSKIYYVTNELTEQEIPVDPIPASKNILVYPYADYSPKEENGITFTDDGTGIITAAGTATAEASYVCSNSLVLAEGSYILSQGTPVGDGATGIYITYLNSDNEEVVLASVVDTAEVTFTITPELAATGLVVTIKTAAAAELTDHVFYPMIRVSTEEDGSFVPYSPEQILPPEIIEVIVEHLDLLHTKTISINETETATDIREVVS